MSAALAIFVKTPGLSPLKTRLAAGIGRVAAEDFHRQAAQAVAAVAWSMQDRLQAHWAVAERAALQDASWRALPTLWQGTGGLGQRLHHVYTELQSRYERILLIGADAPQISTELLQQALDALQHAPFVLGPSSDGGFWLFGGREPIDEAVWRAVRYSNADTADSLRAALTTRGQVASLPELTDLDRVEDLPALHAALIAHDTLLPQQRRLLEWVETVRRGLQETTRPSSESTAD